MSMNLVLWRHAEADDALDDLDRALTAKGRRQAERMARWLEARLPGKYRVYASRARRSQETARALTERFRTTAELDPGATPEAVLAAVNWPEAGGTVVAVGHQPWIGEVAAALITGRAVEWPVKKGGIVWISRRERGDEPGTVLRVVLPPDLV